MSVEPGKFPEENFGALEGCFVEGDPEQRARERRRRRRALVFSVLLQSAVLIAVVIVPLFAKTERVTLPNITPVPPYSPYRRAAVTPTGRQVAEPPKCHICFSRIPQTIVTHTPQEPSSSQDDPPIGDSNVPANPTGIRILDPRPQPVEPPPLQPEQPRVVHRTSIDPAMLRRRIDPEYPILAKQTHREGRVELHAMIGTDGFIQSLQIVGGDAMFYSSALAAVQQWVYRPTYLNGVAVQVDTTITVIYTMQH
jgi:periplasmic protein TonB